MENDSAREQELCETTDSEDDSVDVSDDKSLEEGLSESLSDIDDAEICSCLNNEKEKEYKKVIWEMMNKKYLQEQEAKRVAATSKVTNSEKLPSVNPKKRKIDSVEGSSTPTQVKDATNEIEDNGNGWEDPEEEYDYYDDNGLF